MFKGILVVLSTPGRTMVMQTITKVRKKVKLMAANAIFYNQKKQTERHELARIAEVLPIL